MISDDSFHDRNTKNKPTAAQVAKEYFDYGCFQYTGYGSEKETDRISWRRKQGDFKEIFKDIICRRNV